MEGTADQNAFLRLWLAHNLHPVILIDATSRIALTKEAGTIQYLTSITTQIYTLFDIFERCSSMSNNQTRRVSSVSNALRLLGVFAESPIGLGVTDLARATGLGKSTVHLLLTTMCDEEFVEKTPSGKYRLGLGAFYVGAAAIPGIPADGRLTPLLQELAEKSGEAVSLAFAHGGDAVIVQRIESVSPLRAEIRVGTRMPMHSSASGKCLLASFPDSQVDVLYPDETLPRVTCRTLRRKTELKTLLAEVRELGYARNHDEYMDGVCGIATLVGSREHKAGLALSIAGPINRFKFVDWIEPLLSTAAAMSQRLTPTEPNDTEKGEAS